MKGLRIFQSRRFTDLGFWNAKKQMRISNSIKLPNCIVWNTRYELRKRSSKNKVELWIRKPKKYYLPVSPNRRTLNHHQLVKTPSTTTNKNVFKCQEMESVGAVCKQRKKKK